MIEGVVQNGVVVLDQPGALPSGTRVRIEEVESSKPAVTKQSTIWEKLQELGKKYENLPCDLPEDFAENHDHYIHGTPKRT